MWARIASLIVGFLLVSIGMGKIFARSITDLKLLLPYVCVGVICLYMGGINVRFFLSDQGVVREFSSWGKKKEELLPWNTIIAIDTIQRKKIFSAFFMKETGKGWQVTFPVVLWEDFLTTVKKARPDLSIQIKN